MASHGKGRGDLRPSLAVRDGDRALIYNCFAGCDPRDVRAAIDRLDVNGAPRLIASPATVRAKRKTTTADALDLSDTAFGKALSALALGFALGLESGFAVLTARFRRAAP